MVGGEEQGCTWVACPVVEIEVRVTALQPPGNDLVMYSAVMEKYHLCYVLENRDWHASSSVIFKGSKRIIVDILYPEGKH